MLSEMKFKILNSIGEQFSREAKQILALIGDVTYRNLSQEQLLTTISEYDIIVCGLNNTFTKEILVSASKLKIIATATTGTDHIDCRVAEELGIRVMSLRNENKFLDKITGTAELALGLMIFSVRNIPAAYNSVLNGEWKREIFIGHNLSSMTLGILGLGRLGKMMARYGKALGMNIIYYDPNVIARNKEFRKVLFDDLVRKSDVLSIHVHLSPITEYMINGKILKKMKSNSIIINTSRGKIVDEDAIIHAINNNIISGYATDVLDGEIGFRADDCRSHPLVKYAKSNNRVIILPHIGGMTFESRMETDIFISNKLAKFIKKF